jgi:hypothetical protein
MTESYVFGRICARLKKVQYMVDHSREFDDRSFEIWGGLRRSPVDTNFTESFRNGIMNSDMIGHFGVLNEL